MQSSSFSDLPPPPEGRSGWMWTAQGSADSVTPEDPQSWPRITVVTPSYNQGEFLEATIRSVLLQGYPNLEYMIIDGGSTDNSVEIIKKYEPWLTYWVSEKDRGQTHAINKGFARSTGEIHAYLNSDDWYEPGAFQRCVREFVRGREWVAGRVHCWQEGGDYRPFPVLPGKSLTRWFQSCPIAQAGSFWSAKLHREAGEFREDLNYVMDYEFWMRLRVKQGIEPFAVEQPVAVFRLHEDAKSIALDTAFADEIRDVLQKYEPLLSRGQRGRLWAARRHRMARKHGARAVSLLKAGKGLDASVEVIAAMRAWPFMAFDLTGFYLAAQGLVRGREEEPVLPEIWPE